MLCLNFVFIKYLKTFSSNLITIGVSKYIRTSEKKIFTIPILPTQQILLRIVFSTVSLDYFEVPGFVLFDINCCTKKKKKTS